MAATAVSVPITNFVWVVSGSVLGWLSDAISYPNRV